MCDCNKTTNISMGCCQPVLGPVEAYYTKFTIDRKLEEITSAITSGCCITPEEVDEKIEEAISGITVSGVTEEEVDAKIASAKTEIEAEIPSLDGYATQQWVEDKHYITGVDLSNYALKSEIPTVPTSNTAFTNDAGYLTEHQSLSGYATEAFVSTFTYDKATIDEKIPSMSGYVTLEEFGDYIMRLRSEIDTLRQQVSGCCEIPPTPTPTGDTDCVVRIKYTQGEDFVIPCEESYIGNLESFELPSPYTRPDATAVTVGNCTAQIGQTCFEDFFQLQTVYIGSACTSIRQEAFYGCSALTTVTIEATTPPSMVWNNTFQGCTSLQHIYVPAQSVNAYKTAQYWDTYANLIEPIV